jgi:hypothetical protein
MRRDLAVARGVSSQTDNVITSVILQVDIPRRHHTNFGTLRYKDVSRHRIEVAILQARHFHRHHRADRHGHHCQRYRQELITLIQALSFPLKLLKSLINRH